MLAGSPDTHAPPPDLDVPAARAAAVHFDGAMRRGMPEDAAWTEAVELFRLHHPAWPRPLAEREAARIVGGLIAWHRSMHGLTATWPVPPVALLRRLANPCGPVAPRPPPQRPRPSAHDGGSRTPTVIGGASSHGISPSA
jgi:hypothetical protein